MCSLFTTHNHQTPSSPYGDHGIHYHLAAICFIPAPPLVSITITVRYGFEDDGPHFHENIAKHSQTLEGLRWNLCGAAQLPVLPEAFDPPSNTPLPHSPRVREFMAVCNKSQPDALKTAALTAAFPNLTTLHLVPSRVFFNHNCLSSRLRDSQPEEARERNQRAQLEIDSRRWTSLTECSGELVHLFSLGLLCHVERLTVWTTISRDEDISMLRQVCRDTRPKYLYLWIHSGVRHLKALHSVVEDEMVCGTLHMLAIGFDDRVENGRLSWEYPPVSHWVVYNILTHSLLTDFPRRLSPTPSPPFPDTFGSLSSSSRATTISLLSR